MTVVCQCPANLSFVCHKYVSIIRKVLGNQTFDYPGNDVSNMVPAYLPARLNRGLGYNRDCPISYTNNECTNE